MNTVPRPDIEEHHGPIDKLRLGVMSALDAWTAKRIDLQRSILLSGLWRSGTTWLHGALASAIGAKMLFEPFEPRSYGERLPDLLPELSNPTWELLSAYLPYVDGALPDRPVMCDYLERAMRGRIDSDYLRGIRPSLGDSLRKHVVVKFTRSALSVRAMHEHFKMPTIHLSRDPRAVAASLLRKPWEWPAKLNLRHQLLEPTDGRRALFAEHQDDIARWDQQGPVVRIVAYWCMTERHLLDRLEGLSRLVYVEYEPLVAGGPAKLGKVLSQLGFDVATDTIEAAFARNSPTTDRQRTAQAPVDRMHSWRKELDAAEISEAERIMARFGFTHRLEATEGSAA